MIHKLLSAALIVASTLVLLFTSPSSHAECQPTWFQALGQSGMNSSVSALCVHNGQLIAGGGFTMAGGISASRVARWNGTAWTALGNGLNGLVMCLTSYNGEIIAGGFFSASGATAVSNIARWNGSSWQPMGSGMNNFVWALTVHNGELYAGGDFTTAGGVSASRVAKWNGSAWQALGSGLAQTVFSLTVFQNSVIAGGNAGSVSRWTGSSWAPIVGLSGGPVYALTSWQSLLIAGGDFTGRFAIGGISTMSPWTPGIINGAVQTLMAFDDEIIVGGSFTSPGSRIFRTDSWGPTGSLGAGLNNSAVRTTIFNGMLVVGGDFTTADGITANRIASWGTHSWVGPASGSFNTASNWSVGTVPGATSTPTFGAQAETNSMTIGFSSHAQSQSLCIVNQNPTFTLNGYTYTVPGGITIGPGTGTLTTTNGTLASSVTLGSSFGLPEWHLNNTTVTGSVDVGFFSGGFFYSGKVTGTGTIGGHLNNRYWVSPGNPSGVLTVNGNYSQTAGPATLEIAVGQTTNGTLQVLGNSTLAGTLRIQLMAKEIPAPGERTILSTGGVQSGQFGALLLPFIGDDLLMTVGYGPGAASADGSTDGAPVGQGGVTINIGAPNGSPDPDNEQTFGLTGEPTGITGLFVDDSPFQFGLVESDLALAVADVDPLQTGDALVLLNDGGGTSFTPVVVAVGREPSGITAAALADGSAVDDLAVPNLGDDTVSVLFHESATPGTYTVVTISTGIGDQPSAITAADLNGDSLADLAVTNQGSNTVSILINNGNRTFTALTPVSVGAAPVSIAAADISGSTLQDLIVANSTAGTLTVLQNLGGGGGTYAPTTVPIGPTPIIVTPSDVDNDRDLDLVVSLKTGGGLALVRNLGGGVLSNPVTLPMDGEPGSLDAWDMDKDGDEDICVIVDDATLDEPVIRLLRNDSTPTQVAYTLFDPIGVGEMPRLVNGSDVSGDAVGDLISVSTAAPPLGLDGEPADGSTWLLGPGDASMSIRRMLGTPCDGDIAPSTGDGSVGVPDLLAIINQWGPCPIPPTGCPADLAPLPSGDNTVGVPDLLFIINNWGACP